MLVAELNKNVQSARVEQTNQRSTNSVDWHVGSRLRLRRLELGMSQERLAEQLGITFQQVQKYERGTNRIGASRLHQIALVLQVPITYFFEGAESESDEKVPSTVDSPLSVALSDASTIRLLRAFALIGDPNVKQKAVSVIEAIAEASSASSASAKATRMQ
jgi:transcriptional regulator with XRE-family HTH domain